MIPILTAQQKKMVLFADRPNRARGRGRGANRGIVAGHLVTMRSCVAKGVATWVVEGGSIRLTPLGVLFAKQYRR